VFTMGCPLRCVYCHNPDTWTKDDTHLRDSRDLAAQILKLYPYIKNGGVTFSGGEPLLQAAFLCEVAEFLKEKGLHIAVDTCGCVDPMTPSVRKLLQLTDLVLLDIKMTTEAAYQMYTGGSLHDVLAFLNFLEQHKKDTWIRHVVVPGLCDTPEDMLRLASLVREYHCIRRVELLPYRALGLEKYKTLGIPYPLDGTPQMDIRMLEELDSILQHQLPDFQKSGR